MGSGRIDSEGLQEDIELLTGLGRKLDERFASLVARASMDRSSGRTVRDVLIRKFVRIRDKERRLVPLVPNRAQREFSENCARRNIVLKARQVGITTFVAARFFASTITQPGTLSVQVAHDQESAEEIFKIVRRFWEKLPRRLRTGALRTSRSNIRQLVFPELDSEYRVETAADPNAGRGLTIHNLHCSEVARWPGKVTETLASLRSAVTGDGEIVLESTPNGAGGSFYEEWQRAEETGYTRHFFPWWYEDSYRVESRDAGELTEEEKELVGRFRLRPGQIAWRRQNWARLRRLAAQEFAEDPNECFLVSGECVFEIEKVSERLGHCGDAIEARDNDRLLIWFPPQANHEYVIGVDPAGGGADGDYSCAEVVDRTSGMQCAELRGHYTPRELATRVAELGRRYNEALVAVERNNHGHAVLAHLAEAEQYGTLYEDEGHLGCLTTAASRPRLVENFVGVFSAAPRLFQSRRLLEECRSFVRHKDGSTAAAAGAHDDCVMAMAIALQVRKSEAGRGMRRMELVSVAG